MAAAACSFVSAVFGFVRIATVKIAVVFVSAMTVVVSHVVMTALASGYAMAAVAFGSATTVVASGSVMTDVASGSALAPGAVCPWLEGDEEDVDATEGS